jgi:predicted membrane channel-forming protein YqfA (hemolysin III family)
MEKTKNFLGALAGCYIFGEMITVYTLIACTSTPQPFPAWFQPAWYFYLVTMSIVIAAVVAALVMVSVREIRRRSRKNRRLGMVRMNVNTGMWYYDHV